MNRVKCSKLLGQKHGRVVVKQRSLMSCSSSSAFLWRLVNRNWGCGVSLTVTRWRKSAYEIWLVLVVQDVSKVRWRTLMYRFMS